MKTLGPKVDWTDPKIVEILLAYPIDGNDNHEKVRQRILEKSKPGVSVSRSSVSRHLKRLNRPDPTTTHQPRDDDDEEEEIDDLRAEFAEVCNIVFHISWGFSMGFGSRCCFVRVLCRARCCLLFLMCVF